MKEGIWKGMMCVLVTVAFVSGSFSVVLSDYISSGDNNSYHFRVENENVWSDLRQTDNKVLEVNTTIGDLDVRYYEHVVNGFEVINDSILLHVDSNSNAVVKYEKRWRDVDDSIIPDTVPSFEPDIPYSWKEKVIFLEKEDCGYFYSFDGNVDFPVACWEVRYKDGITLLHNFEGNVIGSGVPIPSDKGFSLNGWSGAEAPHCWREWRLNADKWFSKWCDSTISVFAPTADEISLVVRDSDVSCFYEIAHGNYDYFQPQTLSDPVYTVGDASKDMAYRPRMKFAFIGSCGGMSYTGHGSFSYVFRKGYMEDTVTVGYVIEEDEDGWCYAVPWQDYMFSKMDEGYTIKKAFDMACQQYPSIISMVRFVGDTDLKITDEIDYNKYPEKPDTPTGPTHVRLRKEYTYRSRTTDPDGDQLYYQWYWDDGDMSDWLGPYDSGETVSTTHSFHWSGELPPLEFRIQVRAKDECGAISEWSDPLPITMPKTYQNSLWQWVEEINKWFIQLVGRNILPSFLRGGIT